eukprot:scaffold170095_cov17-Tisochrysis_lutea.AAC.1
MSEWYYFIFVKFIPKAELRPLSAKPEANSIASLNKAWICEDETKYRTSLQGAGGPFLAGALI